MSHSHFLKYTSPEFEWIGSGIITHLIIQPTSFCSYITALKYTPTWQNFGAGKNNEFGKSSTIH